MGKRVVRTIEVVKEKEYGEHDELCIVFTTLSVGLR